MLDIGGWEFLVVAFVLLMVVGPKELPKMLRGFTRFTRQMRAMASEFTRGMEDIATQSEVKDLKNTIADFKQGDYSNLADAIDPAGELGDAVNETKRSFADGSDLDDMKSLAKDTNSMIAGDAQHSTTRKTPAKKSKSKKTTQASTAKKSKKTAG